MDKIHDEIRADEDLRSRDIMTELTTNLCKESSQLGLQRIGYCLDVMMKSVWFERPQPPDYNRFSGMFPILKTEILNTEYVFAMYQDLPFETAKFDQLVFKEGKRPPNPNAPGGTTAAAPKQQEEVKEELDDEAKEKARAEEQKKKDRAAMRAKLLAPFDDKVTKKLQMLDKDKPPAKPAPSAFNPIIKQMPGIDSPEKKALSPLAPISLAKPKPPIGTPVVKPVSNLGKGKEFNEDVQKRLARLRKLD